MFKRILVANRGEIALRVMRTCREMGIDTACVFSEADRGSDYLKLASRAVCIGPGPAGESYLKGDRIIAAAEMVGADAIHPGYGFLAENAQFADMCRDSNMEFIGPSSESIRLLGDKAAARKLAKKAKVPTVPGSDGVVEDDAEALKVASKIGYPVMVKALAGGGGRGLRIVRTADDLKHALATSRQEALKAFSNAGVYIEKFIENPRHVEVQLLADQKGQCVHVFERDCTVQRRYQKLIEESPSPGIPDRTREEMCKAAVRLAKAASYYNAATVEFVVDQKGHPYFIEVNTRIQVEHPVTEMITGLDLIRCQVEIAAGQPLRFAQKEIKRSGHAIECRINAEDPAHNFRPSPGKIEHMTVPGGWGVRFDSHAHAGYTISPRYDSMIGKLIVHRPTRDEAIAAMRRCLDELSVDPIKTTIPLFQRIMRDDTFASGKFDTGYVERLKLDEASA
ncbi:MAG TPA: acetyl-CoA carboxylase biotin carboxylase subunit [Phycisphaerae bacterium]|nr:acetyl-CoA carboxylase biotin carboxylase subunit [Phycisphaerales bacterium]HRX87528.1 acetyl-CoA carboxylase biotin carboxylase subunit [Phycisphaerae bacterium]